MESRQASLGPGGRLPLGRVVWEAEDQGPSTQKETGRRRPVSSVIDEVWLLVAVRGVGLKTLFECGQPPGEIGDLLILLGAELFQGG